MTTTLTAKTFDYGYAKVRDFNINATRQLTNKGERVVAKSVEVNGRKCQPSKRFWTSIQVRFGFSSNIFRYFDHAEVFNRISDKAPNDQIKYCIEHDTKTNVDTILAVTNPRNISVKHDQLYELLNAYDAKEVSYDKGIVRSTHVPRIGAQPFQIAGDEFTNQFVIDTPIDGFGRPNIYLSMLRILCTNGAIGYNKAFRSELSSGKTDDDMLFSLIRAMDSFNNEEGFSAMRSRFEAATRSWASVNEVQRLYKTLVTSASRGLLEKRGREMIDGSLVETSIPIFNAFNAATGDIAQLYGLSSLDSLSVKRQRTLPASCKVYDLLNFATEVATHHAKEGGNRHIQAYVGDTLCTEFDLEGTVDQFSDWRDFFIQNEATADTVRAMNTRSGD